MKILVIADSHGRTNNIIDILMRHSDIEIVVHLGDYGTDVHKIELFNPCIIVYAVQGNNDRDKILPLEEFIQLAGKRIFITHGHGYGVKRGLECIIAKGKQENVDVILYGHTHNPKVEWVDNILLVNPGSICYPKEFSGYAYAILEITKEHVYANIIKL